MFEFASQPSAERPGGCWQTRGILRRRRSATLPRGPGDRMGDEGGKNGHLGKIPGYPISRHTPKKNTWTGWWFQTCFIFPFHILDKPSQSDELHHFSRWLKHVIARPTRWNYTCTLHHQPAGTYDSPCDFPFHTRHHQRETLGDGTIWDFGIPHDPTKIGVSSMAIFQGGVQYPKNGDIYKSLDSMLLFPCFFWRCSKLIPSCVRRTFSIFCTPIWSCQPPSLQRFRQQMPLARFCGMEW